MTDEQERIREAGRQNMLAFERGIRDHAPVMIDGTADMFRVVAPGTISPLLGITRWGSEEWRAERHADWFCSLPWYRQWWAMVRIKR